MHSFGDCPVGGVILNNGGCVEKESRESGATTRRDSAGQCARYRRSLREIFCGRRFVPSLSEGKEVGVSGCIKRQPS